MLSYEQPIAFLPACLPPPSSACNHVARWLWARRRSEPVLRWHSYHTTTRYVLVNHTRAVATPFFRTALSHEDQIVQGFQPSHWTVLLHLRVHHFMTGLRSLFPALTLHEDQIAQGFQPSRWTVIQHLRVHHFITGLRSQSPALTLNPVCVRCSFGLPLTGPPFLVLRTLNLRIGGVRCPLLEGHRFRDPREYKQRVFEPHNTTGYVCE